MVNYNLEGLEGLKNLEGLQNINGLDELLKVIGTAGVLVAFFAILACVAVILLWVFGSIGLMNLAKEHQIPNAWLSFFPVGRSYIIGKLGYEVYDKENKNATTFMWLTLGLGAAAFVLGNSNGDLHTLIIYGLLFFETYAFYNMFKVLNPKNVTVYTVLIAIVGVLLRGSTLLGGIFLYFMKQPEENKKESEFSDNEEIEEKKEVKKETVKGKFCSNCGAKLTKDAKFCPECGKIVK